jgi:tetratricopeptide (TPR) repeat protein
MRDTLSALAVPAAVLAVLSGLAVQAAQAAAEVAAPSAVDAGQGAVAPITDRESGLTRTELDAMLTGLGDPDVSRRRAGAAAVASLGEEAVAVIVDRLGDMRRGSDEGAASLLRSMRDRGAHEQGPDWVEALLAQRPDAPQHRALATVCLLRALAHARTTPAAKQLLLASSDLAGALRPEIVRLVKQMGERAVPALIESRLDAAPETRSFGASLLEAIGKRAPAEAVRTSDNHLLSETLRAYGAAGDLEALPLVLSFANSERAEVRAAARRATLAYGQDAVWRLREAYAVLLGEPAPEGATAADLAAKLFEEYDRYRMRDVGALVERGLSALRAGNVDEAVVTFDEALSREPMVDRRGDMAPAYVRRAESLMQPDPATALALLRKALRLDDRGRQADHVRSQILYLEGQQARIRGVDDTHPFEQALLLDPDNHTARTSLAAMRPAPEQTPRATWRLVAAGFVIAVAVAGIALLGGTRKRGATSPTTRP